MENTEVLENIDGEEASIMETESGDFIVTFEAGSFDAEEIGNKSFPSFNAAARFLYRNGYRF